MGGQRSRGMGSLERAAHVASPSPIPSILWCWPRAEFSIWEDVCVCFGGWRGGRAANAAPLELFNGINVFGEWGGCYSPPNTPPLPGCLDLLIVELSPAGAR